MFRPGYKSGYQGRFETALADDSTDEIQGVEGSQSQQPEIPRQYRPYDQDGAEEETEEQITAKSQSRTAHISKIEKVFVIGFSVVVDIVQIGFNALAGSGLVINRFIDIAYGILLFVYTVLRGIVNTRTTVATIATFVGEEMPAIDIAPFWTFDAFYIFYSNDGKLPINVPGASKIIGKVIPMNVDGVRLPVKK